MQKPKADPGEVCPFNGKDVSKVCHKCPLFIQIRGVDNNTGKEVDHWGCSLALLPMLMIENSNQQRQTSASVDSFRNEMVRANERAVNAALIVASVPKQKLIEG